MTIIPFQTIKTQHSPGELRAICCDAEGRATATFMERWSGKDGPARLGSTHRARIRAFADEIRGAFGELESGEEVFLRLKDRAALTEGAELVLQISSEWRNDKLARGRIVEGRGDELTTFERWQNTLRSDASLPITEDATSVEAVFEDALHSSVSLEGGGRMHIDRTRALIAFDVDTHGRTGKGSAGARALAVNQDAIQEMVRQVSLRCMGGNLVLDCVSPINTDAANRLRETARSAFARFGFETAKALRPSPLGLLEASVPWQYTPIEDVLSRDPAETRLLALCRELQREATASPVRFFDLRLADPEMSVYQRRSSELDVSFRDLYGGRVSVINGDDGISKVLPR